MRTQSRQSPAADDEARAILPPAKEWVVAACRPRAPGDAPIGVPDTLDWDHALDTAHANFVSPLVAEALAGLPLPVPVRARIKEAQAHAALRGAVAREELGRIEALFAESGVRAILYKGLDLEERFYPERRRRLFGDIDLIVRDADIEVSDRALLSAGYAPPPGGPPLAYYRRFHLHQVYHHADRRFPIELHWAVDSPYAVDRIPMDELFQRARPRRGDNVLSPDELDTLLLVASHLDKHIGLCAELPTRETRLKAVLDAGGLLWVMDVVYGLSHLSDAAAKRLVDHAAALRCRPALHRACRLAADVAPGRVPTFALPEGQPKPSLAARLAYPDLARDRPVTAQGIRRRAFLFETLEHLTFRPVRVLEALGGRSGPEESRLHTLATVGTLGVRNPRRLPSLATHSLVARARRSARPRQSNFDE